MKLISSLLVLSLALPSVAVAQTPPAAPPTASSVTPPKLLPIPPGDDKIVPLRKGEPAPFDGQLFDNNTALRWGHYLEQSHEFLNLDAALSVRLLKIQETYYTSVLKIEQDKYVRVTSDLEAKWKKAEYERDHPPWYQSGWFTFTLGVVATGCAIGLGAYTVHALK